MSQQGNDVDRLWSLIRDVEVAMLTTEDGGVLRSRPMAAAERDGDATLWLFTRASSHKVSELARDERVNLSYAAPSSQTYVSVSGTATLVRDPAAVAARWRESLRVWFPKGREDPDIALLRVTIEQAEYWDAPSSTMLHAIGYVTAALTGEPPHPGGHGTIMKGELTAAQTDM
jgi:general stress protein 26